ncbi:MAG: hypothetical protein LIQ31_00995 [Planctomycetes bacterium]|nr:hypothetical protein [Planctomycetota bacterium]
MPFKTPSTDTSPRLEHGHKRPWGKVCVIILFIVAVVVSGREIKQWSGPPDARGDGESLSGTSRHRGVGTTRDGNGNHFFSYRGDQFYVPCPSGFHVSFDTPEEPRALLHFTIDTTETTAMYPASHRTIVEVAGVSERRMTEREYLGQIASLGQSLPGTIEMPFTWNAAKYHPGLPDVDVHAQTTLTRVPIDDPLADGLLFYQGTMHLSSEEAEVPETVVMNCSIGFLFVKGRCFFLRAINASGKADMNGFARNIIDWRDAIRAANRE